MPTSSATGLPSGPPAPPTEPEKASRRPGQGAHHHQSLLWREDVQAGSWGQGQADRLPPLVLTAERPSLARRKLRRLRVPLCTRAHTPFTFRGTFSLEPQILR